MLFCIQVLIEVFRFLHYCFVFCSCSSFICYFNEFQSWVFWVHQTQKLCIIFFTFLHSSSEHKSFRFFCLDDLDLGFDHFYVSVYYQIASVLEFSTFGSLSARQDLNCRLIQSLAHGHVSVIWIVHSSDYGKCLWVLATTFSSFIQNNFNIELLKHNLNMGFP